jgi:hypothetical protein
MQPGMKLLKYSACAVGIVLSMLVGTPLRHLEAAGRQDCKLNSGQLTVGRSGRRDLPL